MKSLLTKVTNKSEVSARKKKEKKSKANNNDHSVRRRKKTPMEKSKSVDPSERSQRRRRRPKHIDSVGVVTTPVKSHSTDSIDFAFHFKETLQPAETGQSPSQKLVYDQFIRYIVALGVDGLLKEYNLEIRPFIGTAVKRAAFDEHITKNRYKDVVCNDYTRVVLDDGREGDYIHANYVRGLQPTYILTQGPLATTVVDFWRMVVHEKATAICMLCDFMECGRRKCERYFPDAVGQKVTFGDFSITCESVDFPDPHTCLLNLVVEVGSVRLTVKHMRLKTWPDKTAPKSTMSVLRQLFLLRSCQHTVIVHCSAGIGRTGTLVGIELCVQTLLNSRPLNMVDICKQLRTCRLSCIQVDVQYLAMAIAIGECGRAFKYVDDAAVLANFAALKEKVDTYVIDHPPPDATMPPSEKNPLNAEAPSRAGQQPAPSQAQAVAQPAVPANPAAQPPAQPVTNPSPATTPTATGAHANPT